jgi:electron transfer flavoprotein alpha subunit
VILVIAEQRDGALNRATWEAVVAAQQLAGGDDLKIALLGAQAGGAAQELAAAGVGAVLTVTDAALEPYTPDGYVLALAQVIASASPQVIALAHTYQARDFAPMLAARLTLPLVTDVTCVSG